MFLIVGIILVGFVFALTTTEVFFDGFEGAAYDLTALWTANAGYVQSNAQAATGTY